MNGGCSANQHWELVFATRQDNSQPVVFREKERKLKGLKGVFFDTRTNKIPSAEGKTLLTVVFLPGWRRHISVALSSNTTSRGRQNNFRSSTNPSSWPMSFQGTGRVGGTGPNANMAASLDDDFEFNNQDYYSLLNVRKEVRFFVFYSGTEWWRTFSRWHWVDFHWLKWSGVGASSFS